LRRRLSETPMMERRSTGVRRQLSDSSPLSIADCWFLKIAIAVFIRRKPNFA
jgi:hypothetical protein